MRALWTLLALFFSLAASAASDYVREQKWADEILASVLIGDPVYLQQGNGHKFLGLYTAVQGAKAGVVHGIGIHPDWGLVSQLRQGLAEAGYATLSIQMPILAADAKAEQYPPTFDEAAERLKLAVADLKAKGYGKVAIVSHSLGCRMTYHYLARQADAPVSGWVMLSTPGADDLAALKLPILDLYGENDLPQVLKNAPSRAKGLVQKGSVQQSLPGADHFFEGRDAALLGSVRDYLERIL